MCTELEAVGLNAPEYHTNAFMLQTIIYNISKKVAIDIEKVAIGSQKVTKEVFELFGASEVARILELSYSGARKVLGKLIDMNVLVAVKGKGKGKYRFLNNDEIK